MFTTDGKISDFYLQDVASFRTYCVSTEFSDKPVSPRQTQLHKKQMLFFKKQQQNHINTWNKQ